MVFFVSAEFYGSTGGEYSSGGSSASFSNPQYYQPGFSGSNSVLFPYLYGGNPTANREMCLARQDFIVQISPGGCTPAVVRSDLLAEQNVPVFCKLQAIQINPAVNPEEIKSISFSYSGKTPVGVTGVTFYQPTKTILSTSKGKNGFPTIDNIGYAVIVLKQQPNENNLTKVISGNLTAKITYDAPVAFGMGINEKLIPVLTEEQWQQRYNEFVFMNGKGFLRVEYVDSGVVRGSVYSDVNHKVSSFEVSRGKSSSEQYLPGFYCNAGYTITYSDSLSAQKSAKLTFDSDEYDVYEGVGGVFADNICKVNKIESSGGSSGIVRGDCQTSSGRKPFVLELGVKSALITFDSSSNDGYSVGSLLYNGDNNNTYFASTGVSSKDKAPFLILVSLPQTTIFSEELKKKLNDYALSLLNTDFKSNVYTYNKQYAIAIIKKGDSVNFIGKDILFSDYTGAISIDTGSGDFENNFNLAVDGYKSVSETYGDVEYEKSDSSNGDTYGKVSLQNAYNLAVSTNKGKVAEEILALYKSKYNELPYGIQDINIDNSKASFVFELSGQKHVVTLKSIYNVGEDLSKVKFMLNGNPVILSEAKEYIISPSSVTQTDGTKKQKTNIQLDSFTDEGAKVIGNCYDTNGKLTTQTESLVIGVQKPVCGENLILQEVTVKSVAKIKIQPVVKNLGSYANVSYRIGIEERAIKLSPEKTKERIARLNESIAKWQNISAKLTSTVKVMKTACFATSAVLQVKNLFSNLGGKAIARTQVMNAANSGWNALCADAMSNGGMPKTGTTMAGGPYASLDDCFSKNNDNIERDVNLLSQQITNVNNEIKAIQEPFTKTTGILGGKTIDADSANAAYVEKLKTELSTSSLSIADDKGQNSIAIKDIASKLDSETLTYDQTRELRLAYNSYIASDTSSTLKKIQEQKLYTSMNNIKQIEAETDNIKQTVANAGTLGIAGTYSVNAQKNKQGIANVEPYTGAVTEATNQFSLPTNTHIQGVMIDGNVYSVALKLAPGSTTQYIIDEGKIFDKNNQQITDNTLISKIKTEHPLFEKFDSSSYNNAFKDAKVKYYETEPYKGMPAVVPFDLKNGWYAATKQTIAAFGNIKTYQDSGAVSSFWLCNVGKNGREEFNTGLGDDLCQQFNMNTGQQLNQFYGLTDKEATQKVQSALQAIEQAANQYGSSIKYVTILGQKITVGNAATNNPETQCQDFMSADDCKLLFNMCDPVICPASRCNLGGKYYVDDVVQSGIAGSLFLCLPNYKEGIFIPVCLTGVQAGVDNYVSILKASRDCLQENLETGRYVGICDEITAIYTCEFFWKQVSPLLNVILPKLLEFAVGGGSRGGGEYMSVQAAWTNMQSSINYFTNVYGINAMKSFKTRSTAEVGTEVCKSFVSTKYPSSFKTLIEPDSPTQFSAWFEEIKQTDSTVPAVSQYKVYYHIYAGNDEGAQYSVYLKDATGVSLYSTTGYGYVDTGYVAKGGYVDQTKDFTGPSGYQQLCVRIGIEEKCGFKQVSTSFAINYIRDKYIQDQATNTQITTEAGCVSGTPGLLATVNPNLQAGVQEATTAQIYSRGLIRICATNNPGGTTEPARWQTVGYCGDTKIRCWLDKSSIADAITSGNAGVLNETISTLDKQAGLLSQQIAGFKELDVNIAASEFGKIEEEINKLNSMNVDDAKANAKVIIVKLDTLDNQYSLNILQKARMFFDRARVYHVLSLVIWKSLPITTQPNAVSSEISGESECKTAGGNIKDDKCATNEEDITDKLTNKKEILDADKVCCKVKGGTTTTETDLGAKVIQAAEELKGQLGKDIYNQYCPKSEGELSCFTVAVSVYYVAGVDKNCVFATNDINPSYAKPACSSCNACSRGQYDLRAGDLLQIYNKNTATGEHNVIFSKWIDKDKKTAEVYSYPATATGNKLILTTVDFNKDPITIIWEPLAKKDTTTTTTTPSQNEITYSPIVEQIASARNFDANLAKAVVKQESNWNPKDKSNAGALGLMQITNSGGYGAVAVSNGECFNRVNNCRGLVFTGWDNIDNPSNTDVSANINLGICYLKCLQEVYRVNLISNLLYAYNHGIGNLEKNCPQYRSDVCFNVIRDDYVEKVLQYYDKYKESSSN
jgi:hypothetical protein